MKYYYPIITTIGLFVLQTAAFAQLQFSGFADVHFVSPLEDQSNIEMHCGQFELGLSSPIRPGINFEGAIAYNSETGTFEAGAGFVELVFTGENGLHSVRSNSFDHIGLSIGQFDVPFGIDWQHIASPDRCLVTAPLLNEKSINSWNDVGINMHADLGPINITSFVVNGATDGFALGGRAAYSPLESFELGASYLSQTETNELGSKPRAFGADIQTITGPLATRMELHYTEDLFEGDFEAIDTINTHHGFYLQTNFDLSSILHIPLVLIGRYDDWSSINNIDEASRVTLGAAYSIINGFEIRAEYLGDNINGEKDIRQFVIQTLVSF